MPGAHNVSNALAAIAVATECGVADKDICQALSEFAGVGRRFQVYGEKSLGQGKVTLIDDYGHHPRELQVTVEALRKAWPDRRLVMIFQPHRYTRTHALFEDFTKVLSKVDMLLMLEVYAAGEDPITGADSRSLCGSIRQRGQVDPIFVEHEADLSTVLQGILQEGDILVTQGAGSIGAIADTLAKGR